MKNNYLKKKFLLFEILCILFYLILVDKFYFYKYEKKIFDLNKDYDYVYVCNMLINKFY